jgi:hypothetical protein
MVNGNRITWEEETNAKFQKVIEEISQMRNHIAHENSELAKKTEYAEALQKVLEFNRQARSVKGDGKASFDPEKFLKQSVKDSLIEIAAANEGLLVVNDAVTILVKANLFSDRDHARNQIYSNIGHYKKLFKKERAGVYRLRGTTKEIPLLLTP